MKLYMHPASPNCIVVLVAAAYGELALDTVVVDLFKGEQSEPAYRALNPNGTVPTLLDGDFVLWESVAVSQYVCEQRPGNPLWPRDPQRRADIARWQCWNLAHWAPAIQPYVYQNLFKRFRGLGEADDAVLELAASSFRRYAAVLNDHLANRDFLVGNSETLADFTVASYLTYAEQARVPLQSYPHICRWRAEIWRLKAWQAVLPTLS